MTPRFQVVPAVYVVFRHGEQVLLQLRQHTGYMDDHWATAAAGHVEAGESVVAAAHREAAEELAVTLDPAHLTPLTVIHRTGGSGDPVDERVDFFFECRRWHGTPVIAEPAKTADLRWFALDTLPRPVVPHELHVLTMLRDGHPTPITALGFD